jgi:acyl-CoA synthetase (NDP forming)
MGYVGNPLDPWGAAEPASAYAAAFRALAGSGAFDVLALVHDFPYRSLPSEVDTALTVLRPLLEATRGRPDLLPVYVSLTSGEPTPELKRLLDEEAAGAPLLRGAVPAFAAIARAARWEARRESRNAAGPRREHWPTLAADRTSWGLDPHYGQHAAAPAIVVLPELESLLELATAGLPTTPVEPASTPEAAVAAADRVGRPVAIKIDAVGLPHKSDSGFVRLDVGTPEAVRHAAAELLALPLPAGARRRGLLVQPMAPMGVELIVGMRRDPQFGPIVLVGLGGVFAEALDDVAVGLAPVSRAEALAMLESLRGRALLAGARGQPPIDRNGIVDIVVRLGRLAVDRPDLVEVDLNPVAAGPGGVIAVDAIVIRAAGAA